MHLIGNTLENSLPTNLPPTFFPHPVDRTFLTTPTNQCLLISRSRLAGIHDFTTPFFKGETQSLSVCLFALFSPTHTVIVHYLVLKYKKTWFVTGIPDYRHLRYLANINVELIGPSLLPRKRNFYHELQREKKNMLNHQPMLFGGVNKNKLRIKLAISTISSTAFFRTLLK